MGTQIRATTANPPVDGVSLAAGWETPTEDTPALSNERMNTYERLTFGSHKTDSRAEL